MFLAGQTVLYGANGVCRITEITTRRVGSFVTEYYVLKPVSSDSTVYVPTANEKLVARIRLLSSADEVRAILDGEDEPMSWIADNHERAERFHEIIAAEECREVVQLVRLLHTRIRELSSSNRRLHLADERVLREAEKMAVDEVATVLGVSRTEALSLILGE